MNELEVIRKFNILRMRAFVFGIDIQVGDEVEVTEFDALHDF